MKIKSCILVTVFLLFQTPILKAQTALPQADIDVLRYGIHLDLSNLSSKTLSGFTDVHLKVVQKDLSEFKLDLTGLKVSKIEYSGKNLTYNQTDPEITVKLPDKIKTDTFTLRIHYSGTPKETSYFGGFYISDSIAFNLGVIIDQSPHCYGKAWFPCRDNFTDKAQYEFFIQTSPKHLAVCNGDLIKKEYINGNSLYHWTLSQPIPTYLAAVAVGNYFIIRDSVKGLEKTIPIELYVLPNQVEQAKASFANLKTCFNHFESLFGAYQWDRIGYVAVPMTAGAMEHATNIAYPITYIDGTALQERVWAHELSHSWFGNLVTCASSAEMWLNEGFARYAEALFFEKIKGKQFFQNYIQDIMKKALLVAPAYEKGFLALDKIPEDHTYGTSVYDKGATVAHTLRNQMGDDVFFGALKQYFKDFAFANADSKQFCAALSEYSKTDLVPFFDSWVRQTGFPQFSVDTFVVRSPEKLKKKNKNQSESSMIQYDISVRQNLLGRTVYSKGTLITLLLLADGDKWIEWRAYINEPNQKISVELDFELKAVILDPEQLLCDARVGQFRRLKKNDKEVGFYNTDAKLNFTSNAEKSVLRMNYNLVEPSNTAENLVLATNGYWKLEGVLPGNSKGQTVFSINSTFKVAKWRESTFENNPGKKLGLYYRTHGGGNWVLKKQLTAPLLEKDKFDALFEEILVGEYAIFWQ